MVDGRRVWRKRSQTTFLFCTLILVTSLPVLAKDNTADRIKALAGSNGVDLVDIGRTAADRPLQLISIPSSDKGANTVLLVANMDGNDPLSTSAALTFAEDVVKNTSSVNWLILPIGNPDGFARYMGSPRSDQHGNGRAVNDDMDDAVNEDGPDDLNGDGFITTMRQRHPEGDWLPVDGHPLLMRRADATKGERGLYRLFEEGIDNDGDGRLNEDPEGGVWVGHNFPHRFEHYTPEYGLFAASEPESRAILEYAFAHPEIAMVLTFGKSNTLRTLPMQDRDEESRPSSYELPGWFAERIGQEEGIKLPLDEIVKLARQVFANPKLSEDRVLGWLDAGAMVNPDRRDKKWWKALIERYTSAMDSAGLPLDKRLDSVDPVPGSFEEWAYYQYGVPSFALDFWTLPTVEKPDSTSKDVALPDDLDEEIAALYTENPKAFVKWKSFNHPEYGEVKIGGMKPGAMDGPTGKALDKLLEPQLAFIDELTASLPKLAVDSVAVVQTAAGIYRVDAWVVNSGFLPYPTYQGRRSERSAPVTLTLAGEVTLLEGRSRQVLGLLKGSGGVEKVSWLVNGVEGSRVSLKLESPSAGWETRTATLMGGGQ